MWVVLNSKSTSWNIVERLIFPAPDSSYTIKSFPDELILIPREDGQKVPCLFLPFKHARFLVIYFHANAEDLGLCYAFCTIIRDLFQVHLLAVEYPGYGICPGKTDEAGIMANAAAAMRFATETLGWPCDGIKIFGRSLGTGPAIALAAEYEVAGVILVSPFTSIRELFRSQVGPLAEMVTDRFRNVELAENIMSPILIIHGQQDTLIPLEHGKSIYEIVPTRKMLVCPAQMSHNTSLLRNVSTFVLPMTQFFSLPDYTFEDIQVPAWVYPGSSEALAREAVADSPCPRPRGGPQAKAIDSQTSPAKFPAPVETSASDSDMLQMRGMPMSTGPSWNQQAPLEQIGQDCAPSASHLVPRTGGPKFVLETPGATPLPTPRAHEDPPLETHGTPRLLEPMRAQGTPGPAAKGDLSPSVVDAGSAREAKEAIGFVGGHGDFKASREYDFAAPAHGTCDSRDLASATDSKTQINQTDAVKEGEGQRRLPSRGAAAVKEENMRPRNELAEPTGSRRYRL